jgi:hypothetical protein
MGSRRAVRFQFYFNAITVSQIGRLDNALEENENPLTLLRSGSGSEVLQDKGVNYLMIMVNLLKCVCFQLGLLIEESKTHMIFWHSILI